ncbi:MAG: hypothetical protein AAF585_29115 [Verrucomicrobiota bacterium]
MPLEDHYSGDTAFYSFARTEEPELDKEFAAWDHRERLIEMCDGDQLIARVVFHFMADRAIKYMESSIPALEGLTPLECMETDFGKARLKEFLLRTPL